MKIKSLIVLLLLILNSSCKKSTKNNIEIRTVVKENAIAMDSSYIKNYHPRVFEFYKSNHFNTIWFNETNREMYLAFLENIDEDGLNPNEYWINSITKNIEDFKQLSPEEITNLDALLSKSFLKLANNIHSGKLNPRNLYSDWEITPDQLINPEKILQKAISNNKITFVLDSLRPANKIYKKLRETLRDYKEVDSDSSSIANLKISINKKIVLNDTNNKLYNIKLKLTYLDLFEPEVCITNIYTKQLEESVKKLQLTHNLTPDGVIGLSTIKALNRSKNYKKNQIIANLERLRWFPRNLGENYVMVNIPEFRLWLIADEDTIVTKKIIVGKIERKTPILSSKFSNIVFNPTWTVPPTILKKDLVPAAMKDSNYFHKNRIKIYENGIVVTPSEWQSMYSNRYRYVQDPGKNNSLGIIKFNFPNKHLVYLHDTNTRSAFSRDGRDLSSGCVRVADPLKLAVDLFKLDGNSAITLEKIQEIIKSEETKSIKIKNPIYIHQFYWTVSIDQNNEIKYNDDIYNLDVPLYNALQIQ